MNPLHAVILGIVEGITEFLPISSTGHLILASRILGLESSEYLKSFEIAIQLGAVLSVVILYARSLLVNFEVVKRILAGFLPTAVVGFLLYGIVKKFLMNSPTTVLVMFFVGGVLLILFENRYREKDDTHEAIAEIPLWKAACVGLFQSLAVVPGVSRSAATILGGLLLGMKRKTIVEFSFLLAVPTMLAATALDLLKTGMHFSEGGWTGLAVGFVTSFMVAMLAVKFLIRFIQRHTFIPFGIYRILAAVFFWRWR